MDKKSFEIDKEIIQKWVLRLISGIFLLILSWVGSSVASTYRKIDDHLTAIDTRLDSIETNQRLGHERGVVKNVRLDKLEGKADDHDQKIGDIDDRLIIVEARLHIK